MFFKRLQEDIASFKARDPAARSPAEIFLCYPGLHAILLHRLANALWKGGWPLSGRLVSHFGRALTGIEIHPGVRIGRRFVIDHGAGVVLGETSIIGDDVTIYQGVTLGGVSPSVDSASQVDQKRHPTLEDGVIIGSGAQVLGPITIGLNARVGANAVVHKDVPAGVTAVGIPARVVMPRDKKKAHEFVAYGEPVEGCPDPVLRTIEDLRSQVAALINRVEGLEGEKEEGEFKSGGDSASGKAAG
ncbi:MAG: serine O-acetyltransferase [Rhodospirillales bacterium]